MKRIVMILTTLMMTSCYTDHTTSEITYEITGTATQADIILVSNNDYSIIGTAGIPWTYSFRIEFKERTFYIFPDYGDPKTVDFSATNKSGFASDMTLNIYVDGELKATKIVTGDGASGTLEYKVKNPLENN